MVDEKIQKAVIQMFTDGYYSAEAEIKVDGKISSFNFDYDEYDGNNYYCSDETYVDFYSHRKVCRLLNEKKFFKLLREKLALENAEVVLAECDEMVFKHHKLI